MNGRAWAGIAEEIRTERARQDGSHPYRVPDAVMLAVLVEEVGEAAQAMNDGSPKAALREEILQCTAVCVKWLELLDLATDDTTRIKGARM